MIDLLLQSSSIALAIYAGFIGLLVGSFLNVVIARYPNMIFHAWTVQSQEWLNTDAAEVESPPSLSSPPSHCPNCKSPIKAWQNIPLISYLILQGKCASCNDPISLRYPMIELLTGIMSAVVVYHLGWSIQSVLGVGLTWALIALSFIDIDHQILPDDIVIPLLWLGLGINLFTIFTDLHSAVIGAIAGYLSFWIVFQLFLLLTAKEGMGHGDFKLMALLGAWFGWHYLPQIILISTFIGAIFGIAIMLLNRGDRDSKIPFGPYIAGAGWIAMIWGEQINRAYLNYANF